MEAEVEGQFFVSPISNPVAGDKLRSKILKLTKARKHSSNIVNQEKKLKRGVKEVIKAIRKGATGICILAGDVNPVDVISHIPVLCEENGLPYIYVRSRMELGAAAQTKKPTSVVILQEPEGDKLLEKYAKLYDKIKSANPYI